MDEYLSVSQFAKQVGVSRAAAYGMLEQERYREYVITDGGVKRVRRSIFSVLEEGVRAQEDNVENEELPIQDTSAVKHEEEVERLLEEVDYLKRMIEEKDKQIVDFAIRFADLAQQAQQIAGQAQILQLNEASKEVPKIEPEVAEEPARKGFWDKLFGR